MTKYEMLYLIDSAASDEKRESVIAKIEGTVTAFGGTVLSTDKWGVKKLAYPIKYKTEAYFVLMTFEAESTALVELDRICGITDEIVRRMVTKLSK